MEKENLNLRKILVTVLLTIIIILIQGNLVNAQFNPVNNFASKFGQTDANGNQNNWIRSIGIGNFTNPPGGLPSDATHAFLHVNSNYLLLPQNGSIPNKGRVFRTDGPDTEDNMWQMFTGPDASATEKGRIFVPANSDDFVIQASQPFGTIRFQLGPMQRMILRDGLAQVHLGIGNNFSDPQHMIHVHTTPIIINQPPPASMIGFTHNLTGASATDGFLVGINSDGVAELRQQENLPIRIFTNDGVLHEQRMIISHDATSNVPRVGIGTSVLTNPRTFLQIGFDCNIAGNGYRDWMDVGELIVNDKEDNMYFGFTGRLFGLSDHVINWGSRDSITEQNRLRFVNTSGVDITIPSGSPVGLEVARMVVSNGEIGRMGIGNFFALGEDPTETLDVDGNARIRQVPEGDYDRALVIDETGVLHWRNIEGGLSTSLGGECDEFNDINPLTSDWEIPLDEYNFVFSGQVQDKTRIGIGIDGCQPSAKLDVFMNTEEFGSTAIKGVVENGAFYQVGVKGFSTASEPSVIGIGVHGMANFSQINTGVVGIAMHTDPFNMDASYNFGGHFIADYGRINVAGYFNAPSLDQNSVHNFGVYAVCPLNAGASGIDYNWAGYFNGQVFVDGDIKYIGNCVDVSDQQFKQNITDYAGAIDIIRELRPVTFYYDTVSFNINFPDDMQYGLIAQEVESFLPDLVSEQLMPPKFDTAGNIISESIQYKGLEYDQLTPILVQAVKELDGNIIDITEIPEAPVLISPVNNDTLQFMPKEIPNVFFVWHSCENTLCYILDFSYSEDMSDVIETQITFDTVVQIVFPLNQDTVVYWSVKSVGAFGLSDYSEIRHFYLKSTFEDYYKKSVSELSDINLKTNINNIEDALTKTMSLQGVNFEWDLANNPGRNLTEGTNLGLIAQEVQQIFPEVVNMDINGYLYIDYTSLIPVLIESVKELKYINDSLSQRLNDMEIRLDNIEQFLIDDLGDVQMKNANDPSFSQEVTLENTKAIVLNQNVPNPFKEQTTISFQIPDNIASAKIVFIDNLGNILKQVEINDRGYGELIVYAHDLSAGHYTYYLVADGNTIESKRMVLTR
jgi:hypothetical protein